MQNVCASDSGLCLTRTNEKDSRVRLRTSSRTIGEDGLKTNPNTNTNTNTNTNPNTNPNPNPKPKKRN